MTRAWACIVCTLAACASAPPPAVSTARDDAPPAERVLSVTPPAALHVRAGQAGELTLQLRIAPGYHVMSDQPSAPQYIATRVELAPVAEIGWQPARFPPSQAFRSADHEIATFSGDVSVAVPFQLAADAPAGTREVSGDVYYQACNRDSCLFPTHAHFAAQLTLDR